MAAAPGPVRNQRLDRLAAAQHGVASTEQLRALGFDRAAQARAVASHRIVSERRGVVRVGGAPRTWESHLLATVLAAGGDAAASHLSAARLWRLVEPGTDWWSSRLEVSSARSLVLDGVTTHRRPVAPAERAVRFGVPVTSVGRTLLDLGSTMDVATLGAATDEALRRQLVPMAALERLVRSVTSTRGRYPGGATALASVLADRGSSYRPGANAWELRMDRLWDEWGLPPAARQYWIRTPHGAFRPDRAIVELRIAVDWNGYEYHGSRSRFDADSDRRADLIAAGWWPLDFTSRSSPERICRTVKALVAERLIALAL